MTRQSRKRAPATTTPSTTAPAPPTTGSQQTRPPVARVTEPKPPPTTATGPPPVAALNGGKGVPDGGKGGAQAPGTVPVAANTSQGKAGKVHDEEQQPAHLGKNKRPDLIGTRPCERFLNGHCNFGKDCWFVHEGEPRVLKPTVPAPQPVSPEPPKPKISLAPTNPWGKVRPPPPDEEASPILDPSANRGARAVSPVHQHMPSSQQLMSSTPPQPLARPIPTPVSSGVVPVSDGSSSPVAAPASNNLWDSSPPSRGGGLVASDPRMVSMPPQSMVGHAEMGALGGFGMGGARGPSQQSQPQQQTPQQLQQQQAIMHMRAQQAMQQGMQAQSMQAQSMQAQSMQAQSMQAQAHHQAQAHAAQMQQAKRAQQMAQAQAQAQMQAIQAQARQAQAQQLAQQAGGQSTGSVSHEASASLEEMRRNESLGLGLGGYAPQQSSMHLGMARGSVESSPPIGPSVTIGGMQRQGGQQAYGSYAGQPFGGGMSAGVLGSSMSLGAAQSQQQQQQQQLKSPTSQPQMNAIGQQWGPFGATGGMSNTSMQQQQAAMAMPPSGALGGMGGIPGGQAQQDGLFGVGGLADLMAGARMGMGNPYEEQSRYGFQGGGQLWQQEARSEIPQMQSFQGGLGGVEWEPPKGEVERPPQQQQPSFSMENYSLSDSLEDSVPRYQQF